MRPWSVIASAVFLASSVMASDPTPEPSGKMDRYGDPLPSGAVARLGTTRFRHSDEVHSLAVSPDGKTLASGGMGRVRLWEASSGRLLASVPHPSTHVYALAFSPDGKSFAASGAAVDGRGPIVLWETATAKPRMTVDHPTGVATLAFSPDGSALVVVGRKGLRFLDPGTGKDLPGLDHPFPDDECVVAFSNDGKQFAVGEEASGQVTIWDAKTRQKLGTFSAEGNVHSLAFSPDGKLLVTGQSGPQFVRLWDVESRKLLRTFDHTPPKEKGRAPHYVLSVAFASDGRTIASGANDGSVHVWDATTGELKAKHQNAAGWVWAVRFFPDGKTLAAAGSMPQIRLFDAGTGKELHDKDEHTGRLADMARSADGRWLATGGEDRTIRVWDLKTTRAVKTLSGSLPDVFSVAFSPDGRRVASGGGDGAVRLWDVESGKERTVTDAHSRQSLAVYTPDGKTLISAGGGEKVCLWEAESGKELTAFMKGGDVIYHLDVSSDGRWLATSATADQSSGQPGDEKVMRIWDLNRTTEHPPPVREHPFPGAVRFSPDGGTLVFVDGDRVRRRDVTRGIDLASLPPFPTPDDSHRISMLVGRKITTVAYPSVADMTFAAGGSWLVTAGSDRTVHLWELATGLELFRLPAADVRVLKLLAGTDDRTLLTLNGDTTVTVWELKPPKWDDRQPPKPEELNAWWDDLASAEGPTAYRAVWGLSSEPEQAVKAVKERLPAALKHLAGESDRLRGLLTDLDSESFERRESASRKLAELGTEAEPALLRLLTASTSPEVRKRVEKLLADDGKGIRKPPPELLRLRRAVTVLERIGGAEACDLLEKMTTAAPDTAVAEDATLALRRLKRTP